MRLVSTLVCLGALFGCSGLLSAMAWLQNLGRHNFTLELDSAVVTGNVRPLFRSFYMWRQYPSFPAARALYEWRSALVVSLSAASFCYVARYRGKLPYWTVACSSVLLIGLPPLICACALRDNTDRLIAGRWLHFALAGMLYACLACAVFGAVGACECRSPRRR